MFFAILFIAIGVALLLNAMGIMTGSFWGFFWAIFFLAAGIKMLVGKGSCPMCRWGSWKVKGNKHDHCCGHNHEEQ
jgi:hypothetical protein